MKIFYWIALLALIVTPAYAGWDDDEDGIGVAAVGCEEVQPNPAMQRRCWYNFVNANATFNTSMLNIRQCENFSVAFTPDFDGADTLARVQFNVCLDDTNVLSCYILENVTLDGNPANNSEVVYGADGTWAYAKITVEATAGANARIEFRCNQ